MASASKKHQAFISESMKGKPVTAITGIGKELGAQLTAHGYGDAVLLLAKFLSLQQDEGQFKSWIKDACGANERYQDDCYKCLQEWCASHL